MLDLIYLFGIQLAHCYSSSRSIVESVVIEIRLSSSKSPKDLGLTIHQRSQKDLMI